MVDFAGGLFACQGMHTCDGDGRQLKNNAASAANFLAGLNFCVYYNSYWLGSSDWFAAYNHVGWYGNLNHTNGENASDHFSGGSC
ncbi:hypothetical protein ACFQ9X_42665 [Catenulispora yoronensis]